MFRNILTIALRTLARNKGYTALNIAGLLAGFVCVWFIFLFIQDEQSYDRHHTRYEQIYRIYIDGALGGNAFTIAVSPNPLAGSLMREFPEVEIATRVAPWFGASAEVKLGDRKINETGFRMADSSYFDVFTHEFIFGDPKTALLKPASMVLTRDAAIRYFGKLDVVGQTLVVEQLPTFTITAVIENVPNQTHLRFNALASYHTTQRSQSTQWLNNNLATYFILRPDADIPSLEKKLVELAARNVGPEVSQALNIPLDKVMAEGGPYVFKIQALRDIHLRSENIREIFEAGGNASYIFIFSTVAIGVLILAGINFMNLATARAARRAREIGVRKVLGSARSALSAQFIGESVFLSTAAFLLSLLVASAVLPWFNQVAGKAITVTQMFAPVRVAGFFALSLVAGLLAGAYPAFFLSGFEPVKTLKGKLAFSRSNGYLRSGLVVFQFALSLVLVIGTLLVNRQMTFIRSKTASFQASQLIIIDQFDKLGNQRTTFLDEAGKIPGVEVASGASSTFSANINTTVFPLQGKEDQEPLLTNQIFGSYDWDKALKMELVAGRFFSRDMATDTLAVVVNQEFVNRAGWSENPLEHALINTGFGPEGVSQPMQIIGVVKNFHIQSVHNVINPMAIFLDRRPDYAYVRLHPGFPKETIDQIRQLWTSMAKGTEFEFEFLDRQINEMYLKEIRSEQILFVFSGIAIFIASLGLFGLAAFATEQRFREIGIRKVLGASASQILSMLTVDFLKLILLAFVIAIPAGYYLSHSWMSEFAYKAEMSAIPYVLAAGSILIIALLTVGSLAYRAAVQNPVHAISQE